MGRASKWMLLARKAKAFTYVSLKALKGTKKKPPKTNDVLGLEQVHEVGQEKQEILVQEEDQTPPKASSVSSQNLVDDKPQEEAGRQEWAATKIQAAFRGAAARKQAREMKALRRLQTMLHGKSAKRQTSNAMRCIQSFARMQSQVRIQRVRLTEVQSQRKEEHHREKALDEQLGDWDDSTLSRDQIRAKIQSKNQAAAKRERTLAYAFSHQLWRSYPKDSSPPNSSSDDEEKPAWNWSWMEQWMASRSWESLEDHSPGLGSRSPARFVASPGRSKQQLPVSYKKVVADIQPKFAPGSPNTRVQRKLTPAMSSPSRMQVQSNSARVHNESQIAGEEKSSPSSSAAATAAAKSRMKNGSEVSVPEQGRSSPLREVNKKNRTLLPRTKGSSPGYICSPGRSSNLVAA